MIEPAESLTPAPCGQLFGVSVGELADALGKSTSAIRKYARGGAIPEADARTEGGHRRWSVASAAAIVRAAGRAVPAGWETIGAVERL